MHPLETEANSSVTKGCFRVILILRVNSVTPAVIVQ